MSTTSSKTLASISNQAVALLNEIKRLDTSFAKLKGEAEQAGLKADSTSPQGYLADIAIIAKRREQDALSKEAIARTESKVNGAVPSDEPVTPRSRMGRFFQAAAQAMG
jgi:hypothetical protein